MVFVVVVVVVVVEEQAVLSITLVLFLVSMLTDRTSNANYATTGARAIASANGVRR